MRIDSISQTQTVQKVQMSSETLKIKQTDGNKASTVLQSEVADRSPEEEKQKQVSEQELIHAIETANKSVQVYDRKLEFSIHEKTKQIMVKVIDTRNDEVVREIPAEKTLDMLASLLEAAGILVDERV